jgi:hypothetical protein
MPEAQRLVPSENVEHKKPARQSTSPEQVPHSSVEAQEDKAPMIRAAMRAKKRLEVIDDWNDNGLKNVEERRLNDAGFWQALRI